MDIVILFNYNYKDNLNASVKPRELEFSVADDLDKLAAGLMLSDDTDVNSQPTTGIPGDPTDDTTFHDYDDYYYER